MNFFLLILFLITAKTNCLFLQKEIGESERNKSYFLRNFKIIFENQNNETEFFPKRFSINLLKLNRTFTFEISKAPEGPSPTLLVFKEKTNELIEFSNKNIKHQAYTEINKIGFATLIKNNDRKNPYTLMASLYHEGNLRGEISPINLNRKRFKRNVKNRGYDSHNNGHAIYQKNNNKLYIPPNHMPNNWYNNYKVSALNQMYHNQRMYNKPSGPVHAVVETLVVTDGAVFDGFLRDSKIKNVDHVFQSMTIYYNHLINSVGILK